ncbi:MAG: hypothetical protein N3D78_01985 [Candidatus Aenigmarchaeota archaeon]|nr:hypothetical protein [Candidatus Aenigmarchaeota archaeon]
MEKTKILIGAPVNKSFLKAAETYFRCVKKIKSKKYKIEVCFATEDREIIGRLKKYSVKFKIPIKILTFRKRGLRLINISLARELIRNYYLSRNFELFMFLDSDIVIERKVLERMVELSKKFHIVINAYPDRNRDIKTLVVSGLGCTLMIREVLEKTNFEKSHHPEDILFFQKIVRKRFRFINGIFGRTIHNNIEVSRRKLNFIEKLKFRLLIIVCFLNIAKLYNFIISKTNIREFIKI